MPDFVTFLAILVIVGIATYSAGWFHAGYATRRDTKKLAAALEKTNKQYKTWAESDVGKAYQRGFTDGSAMVLDTIDGLLARSKKDASP